MTLGVVLFATTTMIGWSFMVSGAWFIFRHQRHPAIPNSLGIGDTSGRRH